MTDAARLSDAELDALTASLAARPVPPDHPPRASVVDIATRQAARPRHHCRRRRSARARRHGRSMADHGPQAAAAELVAASIARLSEDATRRRRHDGGICRSWRSAPLLAAVFDGDDAVYERVLEMKAEIAEARATIRSLELERERDRASLAEMRSQARANLTSSSRV